MNYLKYNFETRASSSAVVLSETHIDTGFTSACAQNLEFYMAKHDHNFAEIKCWFKKYISQRKKETDKEGFLRREALPYYLAAISSRLSKSFLKPFLELLDLMSIRGYERQLRTWHELWIHANQFMKQNKFNFQWAEENGPNHE